MNNPYNILTDFFYWFEFAKEVHADKIEPRIYYWMRRLFNRRGVRPLDDYMPPSGRLLFKLAHFMLKMEDGVMTTSGVFQFDLKRSSHNSWRLDVGTVLCGSKWVHPFYFDDREPGWKRKSVDYIDMFAKDCAEQFRRECTNANAANFIAYNPVNEATTAIDKKDLLRGIREAMSAYRSKSNKKIWLFDREVFEQVETKAMEQTSPWGSPLTMQSFLSMPYEVHADNMACMARATELIREYDEVWMAARMYGEVAAVNLSSLLVRHDPFQHEFFGLGSPR